MSLTISPPAVLLGVQEPRLWTAPPSVTTEAGDQAVELAESVGVFLDPWQQFAVRLMCSERADGKWSAFEVALLVARQNGKGEILLVRTLAGLFLFGERLILHSAHEFKTASEAFLRIKAVVDGSDDLRRHVARIRTSHGDEGIELNDGRRLRFVARSRSSGRGFTADAAVLDECQELPTSAIGALMPTMSARPNPQIVYTGTVPGPDDNGEHFARLRNRGRSGDDRSLAWMEWSPDDGDFDLDDREVWAQSNPAMGLRDLVEESVERERASMDDEQFARERLSFWPLTSVAGAISPEAWSLLEDADGDRPSPVAFAVEVSPDRKWCSISMAGRRPDGSRFVQLVESERGTAWVKDRVAELAERWKPLGVALNPSGPAGSLLPALQSVPKLPVVTVAGRDLSAACGMFADGVADGSIRHAGQTVVSVAVGASRWRHVGDARQFTAADRSVDIAPLWGVTLALFALERAAKSPARSGVVVGVR